MCDDSFDFVFFFSIDEVRGRLGEVWAVWEFHDKESVGMHGIHREFSSSWVVQVDRRLGIFLG